MHIMIAVQEELPNMEASGPVGKWVRKMHSKQYKAPFVSDPWARCRPREVRFYDFTIPEVIKDEVLRDLTPYVGGKLMKLSKIAQIPLLKGLIEKKLGLKQVDMTPYIEENRDPQKRIAKDIGVRIAILGILEDGYTEDGIELL